MIASLVEIGERNRGRISAETGQEVVVGHDLPDSVLGAAEIVMAFGDFDRELLSRCKALRWLFVMSAGVDGLPFDELARRKILISNVSGLHARHMAEQALGMMICFSRGLHASFFNQLHKKWERNIPLGALYGKTLCIVGAGHIGRETARKAKAFDMRVIGLKRTAAPLADFDEVWDMSRFHEALSQSDYVLLLTPLTDQTSGLMGKAEFAAMKKTAVFLNFSRGGTVDEDALIGALRGKVIAGAGLDVFRNEPLQKESPLWEMENVIVTPHDAGLMPGIFDGAVDMFLSAHGAYRAGGRLPNLVDPRRHY